MNNLKNATVVEGVLVNNYAIRLYSKKIVAERFGSEMPEMIVKAWKNKEDLPCLLQNDLECQEAWNTKEDSLFMSVPAIMDFYRNGPSGMLDQIKEQMILAHKGYIYYIMNHYFFSFRSYEEDLYDCGVIGLIKALKDYNWKNAFTTYSKMFVIHEMAAFTYYLQGNPSCYYAQIQRRIKDVIGSDLDIQIPINEISEKTGIKADIVSRELMVMRATEFVWIDASPSLVNAIEDKRENIDAEVEKKLEMEILKNAILKLNENERELILMYFFKNYSFGRIAREKGIYYNLVRKQYNEVLDKLKREIRARLYL